MPNRTRTGSPSASSGPPATALCLAALAVLAAPALARAAAVDFFAVADRDEIGLEDTLTLTVTVATDLSAGGSEELQLPETPDFQVLSRSQSQQTSFSMSGAGPSTFRKVRTFTLQLVPRRAGTLTILPGRLVLGGQAYETGTLEVRVVPGRAPPPPRAAPPPRPAPAPNPFGLPPGMLDDGDPSDAFDQLFGGDAARPASDSDLYLRMVTDRRQAYLGEQILLSIYLFSRVEVSGVDNPRFPRLDGFWAEDVETPSQITGELKVIDGIPYRVFLLRKRALFPIKSGRLTVDAVEVDVNTGYGLMFSGRKVHRAAQPLTLEVLPLPPGAPPGFQSSNVGRWKLSAEASPTSLTLGQPVTLKVVLEGVGNLRNVAPPRLGPVRGLRVYDPTTTEKMSTGRGRFGGSRTQEYLLMPEQTGELEIPSLSFVFFNPASRQYEASATSPIQLRVTAGATGAASPSSLDPGAAAPERSVNLVSATGLRPLRYRTDLSRPAPPFWRRPFFLPVAAAPLLAGLGALLLGLARSSLTGSDGERRRRQAASRARRRLRKAEKRLGAHQAEPFYAEVSRALSEYLEDKLGTPVAGLTRADLLARLAERSVPPEMLVRLLGLLDTCDAGRFAPGASERGTMARVHAGALKVMGEIESTRLAPREVRP